MITSYRQGFSRAVVNLLRKSRSVSCLALSLLSFSSFQLVAAEETSLEGLFERVKSGSTAEAQRNRQREQRFASSAAEKAKMLRDVQSKVRQQEALKDRLKSEFDANEDRLAEITTTLDRRIGDLGELFESFVRPQTTPKIFCSTRL